MHFPGTREEVRRFGAKAKFLRPVVPSTTDSRLFVQVLKEDKMDRRFQSSREGRFQRDGRGMLHDPREETDPRARVGESFKEPGHQTHREQWGVEMVAEKGNKIGETLLV